MYLNIVIITLICAVVVWFGIPVLYRWHACIRYRKICSKGIVCLTYDDGPDMTLTPHVLQILNEYSVQATFFVLGSRITNHPELRNQIAENRHEIGSHSQWHRNAWRCLPFMSFADIKLGHATVENAAGTTAIARPPYGRLDLMTLIWMKLKKISPIWWTHDSSDCRLGNKTVERLLDEVTRDGGGIILFHDYLPKNENSEARREYVLDCTRGLIAHGQELGWKFIVASELDSISGNKI